MPADVQLRQHILPFQQQYPDLTLQIASKAGSGQGSILNYLRTGRTVAPSILPDLVLLPAFQLPIAANEQLVYPLDRLLDPNLTAELYPVAAELGQMNDQWLGYPLSLDGLIHLAYDQTIITQTFPTNWDTLIAQPQTRLIFPGAGEDGVYLLLQFYLAFGGELLDDNNQPTLQPDLLALALTQFSLGRNSGFILPQSGMLESWDAAWQWFQSGQAELVAVPFELFWTAQRQGRTDGFAALPTPAGAAIPLVEGWVLAVTTPDAAQQRMAANLINWLGQEENMGRWNGTMGKMPARPTAWHSFPSNDPYTLFLQTELNRAQPLPITLTTELTTILSDALLSVITLQSSPQAAAETAANKTNN